MSELQARIERAILGRTAPKAAEAVMAVLAELAADWTDASMEHYYATRHTGPIDYAAGVEAGWDHAAALLLGSDQAPPQCPWSS